MLFFVIRASQITTPKPRLDVGHGNATLAGAMAAATLVVVLPCTMTRSARCSRCESCSFRPGYPVISDRDADVTVPRSSSVCTPNSSSSSGGALPC